MALAACLSKALEESALFPGKAQLLRKQVLMAPRAGSQNGGAIDEDDAYRQLCKCPGASARIITICKTIIDATQNSGMRSPMRKPRTLPKLIQRAINRDASTLRKADCGLRRRFRGRYGVRFKPRQAASARHCEVNERFIKIPDGVSVHSIGLGAKKVDSDRRFTMTRRGERVVQSPFSSRNA